MASWSTHPPSMSAVLRSLPNRPRSGSPTCSSRRCSARPGNRRTGTTSRWWPCSACWACGSSRHQRGHRRPRRRARPPGPTRVRQGTKAVLVLLPPAVGRATDRVTGSRMRGPVLLNGRGARMDRHAATRRLHHLAETAGIRVTRAHPHMLRHTFVTTLKELLSRGLVGITSHQRERTHLRVEGVADPHIYALTDMFTRSDAPGRCRTKLAAVRARYVGLCTRSRACRWPGGTGTGTRGSTAGCSRCPLSARRLLMAQPEAEVLAAVRQA